MNSYNDNLRASTSNTLQALLLENKQLQNNLEAAELELYFSEGARVKAQDKLEDVKDLYDKQHLVKTQGVINDNIAVNMLASATSAEANTKKVISEVATAASNVEVAAKAIVQLASDLGGIYNMARTTTYKSPDIYKKCSNANDLISTTAYNAEVASDMAMTASKLAAEISAEAVLTQATTAKTSVDTLSTTVSTQFEATAKAREACVKDVDTTRNVEKQKEGIVADINADYRASWQSYDVTKSQLNYDLTVSKINTYGFTVSFDEFNLPFDAAKKKHNQSEDQKFFGRDQVSTYYIMVVKASKRSQFGLSDAESVLFDKKRYVKVEPNSDYKKVRAMNLLSPLLAEDAKTDELPDVYYEVPMYIDEIQDTDGNELLLGTEYVVFTYIEMSKDYKRMVGVIEDLMTSASKDFIITTKLMAPAEPVVPTSNGSTQDDVVVEYTAITYDADTSLITAVIDDVSPVLADEILEESPRFEYRCMLLQNDPYVVHGLMSTDTLKTIETQVQQLEIIAEEYDPIIASTQTQINSHEANLIAIDVKIGEYEEQIEALINANETDKVEPIAKELADAKKARRKLKTDLTNLKKELSNLKAARKSQMADIKKNYESHPAIFFNANIASEVSAANYMTTKKAHVVGDDNASDLEIIKKHEVDTIIKITTVDGKVISRDQVKKERNDYEVSHNANPDESNPATYTITVTFLVKSDSVDCYGYPIFNGKYLPAVLAAASAVSNPIEYTNKLTIGEEINLTVPPATSDEDSDQSTDDGSGNDGSDDTGSDAGAIKKAPTSGKGKKGKK